jgi:hypothetical protein
MPGMIHLVIIGTALRAVPVSVVVGASDE